jgi:hypothetical protein
MSRCASSRRRTPAAVAARIGPAAQECTVDYFCPPDWCHAIVTSLQPPSFREPPASAQERDDVGCNLFRDGHGRCDGVLRRLWTAMTVHLVNPSHLSFGVGVITPRWLFVLGAATPPRYGRPLIVDETLEPLDLETVRAGDIVGIGMFVMLTPYPGTIDFESWENKVGTGAKEVAGIPVTRHWLIPQADRPKVYASHPVMTPDEIRAHPGGVGSLLQSSPRVGALAVHAHAACAPRFRPDFEALSTDVREHRDRHRQRARESRQPVGAAHRPAVPAPVRRAAIGRSAVRVDDSGRLPGPEPGMGRTQ